MLHRRRLRRTDLRRHCSRALHRSRLRRMDLRRRHGPLHRRGFVSPHRRSRRLHRSRLVGANLRRRRNRARHRSRPIRLNLSRRYRSLDRRSRWLLVSGRTARRRLERCWLGLRAGGRRCRLRADTTVHRRMDRLLLRRVGNGGAPRWRRLERPLRLHMGAGLRRRNRRCGPGHRRLDRALRPRCRLGRDRYGVRRCNLSRRRCRSVNDDRRYGPCVSDNLDGPSRRRSHLSLLQNRKRHTGISRQRLLS